MRNLFIILLSVTLHSAMAQVSVRTIQELTTDTSGIDLVKEWSHNAKNKVECLPMNKTAGEQTLYNLKVTTRSPMGAIAFFTGGILIENGWLRILGSGSEKLTRSIVSWNKGKTYTQFGEQPKFLLVADDVLGGMFAINAGGLGTDMGKIYYFAPERLEWEPLDLTYSNFLKFCFNGDVNGFYKDFRWDNWEQDLQNIKSDQALFFMPFLWTKEGKDLNKVSKKPVPIEEIYSLNISNQLSLKH